MSIQKSVKKVPWKQARKEIEISSLSAQKAFKRGPQINPKSMKILFRTPRVHPAAPMVLQGAPEVLKWFPKTIFG